MANNFKRTLLAEDGFAKIHSEALGDNTNQFTDKDIGMAVKITANSYVPCADGDEIGGFVVSLSPETSNGYSLGSVKKSHRVEAKVGALVGAVNLAVGKLVVASAQQAFGAGDGYGRVKEGAPATHKWEVIAVNTDGSVGDIVLLERV